jgi:hypothetical protein
VVSSSIERPVYLQLLILGVDPELLARHGAGEPGERSQACITTPKRVAWR